MTANRGIFGGVVGKIGLFEMDETGWLLTVVCLVV